MYVSVGSSVVSLYVLVGPWRGTNNALYKDYQCMYLLAILLYHCMHACLHFWCILHFWRIIVFPVGSSAVSLHVYVGPSSWFIIACVCWPFGWRIIICIYWPFWLMYHCMYMLVLLADISLNVYVDPSDWCIIVCVDGPSSWCIIVCVCWPF